MNRVEWAAFRIAITLPGFTGLRVNEIRELTLEQLLQFKDNRSLQVYQGKHNKHRTVLLSQEGFTVLSKLNKETREVFSKRKTLSGDVDKNTWISFINKKLNKAAKAFNINLKYHSFTINFVTSLLRIPPVQQVSQLVGHKDLTSTIVYSRYTIDTVEAQQLLYKGLYKSVEVDRDQDNRDSHTISP